MNDLRCQLYDRHWFFGYDGNLFVMFVWKHLAEPAHRTEYPEHEPQQAHPDVRK
jgi:hypothetical protein